MNYDLKPVEERHTIGGVEYILREADEDAALQYRSASLTGMEMTIDEDNGTRTTKRMHGIAAVQSLLVSLCLFEVINAADQQTRAVPIAVVKKWPSRVVRSLFDRIKAVSDLDEKDDLAALEKQLDRLQKRIAKLKADQPKNELSATMDTSV